MNPKSSDTLPLSYKDAFFSPRVHSSDKWEHYFEIYDHIFSHFYGEDITYVEIGVQNGGGLEVARKLFGASSNIIGVDIDPRCKRLEDDGTADRMVIGSQVDLDVIKQLKKIAPRVDVLIDDGSHTQAHMVASFISLFETISNGGVYVIEDTHTIYSPEHQQSFHGISVYDFFKGLSERLNLDFIDPEARKIRYKTARETRVGEIFPSTEIHRKIFSIEFFNSVICIRKKDQLEPLRLRR